MKRFCLFVCLSFIIFVAGCSQWSNKKIDITETAFSVDSCDRYFQLLDCILDKDSDETYTESDRLDIREQIKSMQEDWSGLDNDTLSENCSSELEKFSTDEVKSELSKIWCSF